MDDTQSLTLLDYCLHAGSENVVIYFRDNLYVVKTLREFQFVDEYEKDQGANVRQKAKDIVNLLQDESRLRQERRSRANMRDRMVSGRNNYDDDNATGVRDEDENARRRSRSVPAGRRRTDDQLQKAIEESMRTAADEQAKHRRTAEEKDLEQAIKLSQEEENKRNKAVEDSNAASLFDDANQLCVVFFSWLLPGSILAQGTTTNKSVPSIRPRPPTTVHRNATSVHRDAAPVHLLQSIPAAGAAGGYAGASSHF